LSQEQQLQFLPEFLEDSSLLLNLKNYSEEQGRILLRCIESDKVMGDGCPCDMRLRPNKKGDIWK